MRKLFILLMFAVSASAYSMNIIFKVSMKGSSKDLSNGVCISGSLPGSCKILPMVNEGNGIYSYSTYNSPGDTAASYFLIDDIWEARETVYLLYALINNTDRHLLCMNMIL